MKEIVLDTLIDALKLLPFLFVAFLIIELIEHKLSDKSKKLISKSDKFGPLVGSLLGLFPQCGFSCLATNLYVTRIISLGTLISIYLATSDEMLPLLLSNNVSISLILKFLLTKFIVGFISGFIIDLLIRKKEEKYDICLENNCHCEKGVFKSSLIHTLKTLSFIMIVSFILNIIFYYFGNDYLNNLIKKDSLLLPFVSSLIGLIPNCGASVILTELYLEGVLSFSNTIAGLLTGSGVAILLLFKNNKNMKENIFILLLVYFIGSLSGLIIGLLGI